MKQIKPGGRASTRKPQFPRWYAKLSEEDFGKTAVRISDKGELAAP